LPLIFDGLIIVFEPPPEEVALDKDTYYQALEEANVKVIKNEISGEELTPFLLEQINTYFNGGLFPIIKSVLTNNMKLGCEIAKQLSGKD